MILEAKFIESNHEMNSAMGIKFVASPFIDDGTVSANSAWSSKNTVDKLCPSFAESGAVATCNPVEGYPMEVVSHIVPKQSGSGDPSPSNIRPITGYDSIKLSRTGRNFFGGEAIADVFLAVGCTKDAENGIITIEPGKCDRTTPFFANFKENTQYTFIFYGRNTYAYAALNHLNLCIRYTDGEEAEFWSDTLGTDQYVVVTSKAGKTVHGIYVTWYSGNTILYYDKCGVFEGAVGLEAFEPYKGNIFTAELGQTVYGGKFNWKTGELTIDRESHVFDGVNKAFDGGIGTANGNTYACAFIKPSAHQFPLCSHLKNSWAETYGYAYLTNTNLDVIIAFIQPFANVQEANAWLADQYAKGTPFTVCYELRDPITIQLTPQEILALSGTNCLFSSTGDTEVIGKADPTAVIQDLYNKLNAVMATTAALTGV